MVAQSSRKRVKRPYSTYKTPSKALSSNSLLAKRETDLHGFLCNALSPENWSKLSGAEQKGLIDLMPEKWRSYEYEKEVEKGAGTGNDMADKDRANKENEDRKGDRVTSGEDREARVDTKESATDPRLQCPLTPTFLQHDIYIKSAVGRFKRDIEAGYYESRWQTEAKKAMKERREGKYDKYLEEHVEELFGEGNDEDDRNDSANGLDGGDAEVSGSDWAKDHTAKSGRRKQGKRSSGEQIEINVPDEMEGGSNCELGEQSRKGKKSLRSRRAKREVNRLRVPGVFGEAVDSLDQEQRG